MQGYTAINGSQANSYCGMEAGSGLGNCLEDIFLPSGGMAMNWDSQQAQQLGQNQGHGQVQGQLLSGAAHGSGLIQAPSNMMGVGWGAELLSNAGGGGGGSRGGGYGGGRGGGLTSTATATATRANAASSGGVLPGSSRQICYIWWSCKGLQVSRWLHNLHQRCQS